MFVDSGAAETFMGYVYFFLPGRVDGHKGLAHLLGNKGAHLAEMSSSVRVLGSYPSAGAPNRSS